MKQLLVSEANHKLKLVGDLTEQEARQVFRELFDKFPAVAELVAEVLRDWRVETWKKESKK